MYPREITTTSFWIRHELPLGPPPPPNGDAKLRKQIKSQNVQFTDEMIEHYVQQERARLDLKWCLDGFFGWNVSNPFLGQLVTANLFGLVHLAYIIDISPVNVTVTPTDRFGNSVVIGFNDIYSAEDGPLYEIFLLNHHRLHTQHVLSYIANQARNHELTQFSQNVPFNMDLMKSADENFEIAWPEGEETWFIHRELPQRNQFVPDKQPVMPIPSTTHLVENSAQEMLVDSNCVVLPVIQQSNAITLLLEQSQANYNALLEQNKLLKGEVIKQNVIINELVLTMKTITSTGILHTITDTIPGLKEQRMKQLKFQPIDYSINYPLFLESSSPYVSPTIDYLYYACGDINVKTVSLTSTSPSSSDSFTSCIIRSFSLDIMLITFIFVGIILGNLGLYPFFYNATNNPYLVSKLSFHGQNTFDWFRTLAVP